MARPGTRPHEPGRSNGPTSCWPICATAAAHRWSPCGPPNTRSLGQLRRAQVTQCSRPHGSRYVSSSPSAAMGMRRSDSNRRRHDEACAELADCRSGRVEPAVVRDHLSTDVDRAVPLVRTPVLTAPSRLDWSPSPLASRQIRAFSLAPTGSQSRPHRSRFTGVRRHPGGSRSAAATWSAGRSTTSSSTRSSCSPIPWSSARARGSSPPRARTQHSSWSTREPPRRG